MFLGNTFQEISFLLNYKIKHSLSIDFGIMLFVELC